MTDNFNLDKYFVKGELIPAIVQEKSTGEVLMLAYMNKESLKKRLRRATPGFGHAAVRNSGTKVPQAVIFKKWFLSAAIATTILCFCK